MVTIIAEACGTHCMCDLKSLAHVHHDMMIQQSCVLQMQRYKVL